MSRALITVMMVVIFIVVLGLSSVESKDKREFSNNDV